jgi:spore protease
LGSLFSSSTRVLFAGLGNPHATADALGPLSVGHIHPTAHLSEEVRKKSACAALSVFAPLVPALSGMQSGTLLHGARAASGATLVLLLDAMVTESPERLGRVIQLTDTGILPGGGIGEGGVKLDRDYLGVPILAIGVPTVLDATTRIRDESGRPIEGFDYLLPREADALVDRFSRMIARAVEGAFGLPHPL